MIDATQLRLTSGGIELDTDPKSFGWLRDSTDLIGNAEGLQERMAEDGYLYLPGFLDREEIASARLAVCQVLAEEGVLNPAFPTDKAIAREGTKMAFRPDIANAGPARDPIRSVVYGDGVMSFYREMLGGEPMHYEYSWLRTVAPGKGTYPHCDVVYMGRGTKNVFTAWIPFGDIPLEVGGLIVVEGSHRDEELKSTYGQLDVDAVCTNQENARQPNAAGFPGFGAISYDMRATRERLNRRLLTAREFRMGDLLTFSLFTVHGSLDNHSREIRFSTDTRYQLASEPADERWVGENPPGHGGTMLRDTIC
ncbi:phytanoyl-CoA dioxygenase [bacterium]|nr:MAG: phytanoyl-CoA dioxygenase [bacterium]